MAVVMPVAAALVMLDAAMHAAGLAATGVVRLAVDFTEVAVADSMAAAVEASTVVAGATGVAAGIAKLGRFSQVSDS